MENGFFEILVVDDELANIFLLEGILRENGYSVKSVSSGKEALQMIISGEVDIVLLDVMMPEVSGIDVLKEMAQKDLLENIPVIMVSAKTESSDVEEALALGALDYVKKPIDEVELLARLKTVVKLKHKDVLLKKANADLQLQNEIITANIESARIIQNAILPDPAILKSKFKHLNIYYKSKDIVNGDFFWFYETDTTLTIVEADCTGHGVYGAFISLIGYIILKRIVEQDELKDPALILQKLNHEFVQLLNSNIEDESDFLFEGMDATIACVDYEKETVSFSAAAQDILYLDANKELHHIEGDFNSIGYESMAMSNEEIVFTKHELPMHDISSFILMSDGFIDQHNPELSGKYSMKRFKEFIERNREILQDDFHQLLDEELFNWQQDSKQTDDITIIAVKL